MSTTGHKGGQSSHEIARNLEYVERLTKEIVNQYGDNLVKMYRTMKRNEMAEALLPGVNIHAARSAMRYALKKLMDPEERMEIAKSRWSESGRENAHTFTPEERSRGQEKRVQTPEQTKHMVESRGDALWTPDEEQTLVDMMKTEADLQTIADAVSAVAQNQRTVVACRTRWLITLFISDKERQEVTRERQIAAGHTFTDEERARGHMFDDADRANAVAALGAIPWSVEEDRVLIGLRDAGKKFREIAKEISSKSGIARTTAGCIGRYYNTLNLGTRKRKKRSSMS